MVDLLTGEKQQTLTSSFAEMLCPSSSLLYLGRTGDQPVRSPSPFPAQPLHHSQPINSSSYLAPQQRRLLSIY